VYTRDGDVMRHPLLPGGWRWTAVQQPVGQPDEPLQRRARGWQLLRL